MAMQTGANQLEGVENVFEKNIGHFEKLVAGAASGESQSRQAPQPLPIQPAQEVQEKTFAQLGQSSEADEAQGEGLFVEEQSNPSAESGLANQMQQDNRSPQQEVIAMTQQEQSAIADRPPPPAIKKAMFR